MKKLFCICFVIMLAFNGFAQTDNVDYSLEGLAKACAYYSRVSSFHEGLALVYKDGKYGFINKKGIEVIPCKYEYAHDFHEGLAQVTIGKKCCFIDINGVEVISCHKYSVVGDFSDGMARVSGDFNGHSGAGYINRRGEEVIPCKYQGGYPFSDGMALVLRDNKWFFIDKNGVEVIQFMYENEPSFHEGLARVSKEKKWGYIDKKGNEVISCKYEYAHDFHEGEAYVFKHEKEGISEILDNDTIWKVNYLRGYINKDGVEGVLWEDNDDDACGQITDINYFSEGLACFSIKCKYGFVDKNKKIVISPIYLYADSARPFSEGFAVVCTEWDNYFFIDKNGNKINSSTYREAHSFSEGLALVEKDGKWGFIDKNGKSTFDFISGSKNVEQLKKNVATFDSHKQEVKTNDDMSSCWFVYGKKRELESENVIANDKIADNFNKEYFSEIKKDKKEVFNLYSTAAKVLSNHPSDSYELSKNDKGYYYLRIIDPSSFWTYTNYLVIVVE